MNKINLFLKYSLISGGFLCIVCSIVVALINSLTEIYIEGDPTILFIAGILTVFVSTLIKCDVNVLEGEQDG